MSDDGFQQMQQRSGRLAWIMALLFAAVVLRLLQLQVIQRPALLEKAERQQFARVEVPGRRGSIVDRHGQVLAESVDTESVFCSATLVKPWERAQVAKALATALGANEREMRRRLDLGKPFWAKRGCRLEATAHLKEFKIGALSYAPETKRVYPQGLLAAHVLGFEDVDGRGLDGVERSYQSVLGGEPGVAEALRDAAGRQIANQRQWITRPKDGSDLRLTLDAALQHIAERELDKAYRKFKAKGGSLVLMDPRTGEILALASVPAYDPADPGAYGPEARRDRAVSDAFEPGSTFKTVTATLALERGVVTPDSPVDCHQGRLQIFGRMVRDHGDVHLGVVPFSQVLAQSSNCGAVEVAQRFGPKVMYEGMTRFGYGQSTGIDLPGENVGLLRPLDRWSPGSMAAIPFGQELSCNLLRVAVTYAAVANGGTLVRPHVVQSLVSADGGTLAPDANFAQRQVMSEKVRQELVGMLKGVVDEGTGVAIALPGYTIAGKTGTAQKFNQATGHYSMQASWSTFVGFAPAENPAFVAAVMLDEPQGMTLGGWTAGPVFRTVLSSALTSYGVAPDEGVASEQQASANAQSRAGGKDAWTAMYKRGAQAAVVKQVAVPKLTGQTEASARLVLARLGLRERGLGKGRVSGQFPDPGSKVLENSTVTLSLEAGAAAAQPAPAPDAPGLWSRLFGKP